MGRRRLPPCCKVESLNKGPWTPEEDMKLVSYIHEHGHENWRALPKLAGLLRCGKSCRLRWLNYLRPDVKRGNFTQEEEETIIDLHALVGNKWSKIAASLPGRTDNEIKNLWHTHLKKRVEPTSTTSSSQKEAAEDHTWKSSVPSLCSYTICANCGTLNAEKVVMNHHSFKLSEESVTSDKVNDHDGLGTEVDKCTPGVQPPAGSCSGSDGRYLPTETTSTVSSLGSSMMYSDHQLQEENWVQGAADDELINDNKRDLIEIPDTNIDQEVLWGFMDDDYCYYSIPAMVPVVEDGIACNNKSMFREELSIEAEIESSRWVASKGFVWE